MDAYGRKRLAATPNPPNWREPGPEQPAMLEGNGLPGAEVTRTMKDLGLRLAEEQHLDVAVGPEAGDEQIGRQEQHPAEHPRRSEREAPGAESVAPGKPQAREQQEGEEVRVELTGPSHGGHVAE